MGVKFNCRVCWGSRYFYCENIESARELVDALASQGKGLRIETRSYNSLVWEGISHEQKVRARG